MSLVIPNFEICEWSPSLNAPWESSAYIFVSDIETLKVCNELIDRHVNYVIYPVRLIDSYRSYLIQCLKDLDFLVNSIKSQSCIINSQLAHLIDVTFVKAQPWRFTNYFISTLFHHIEYEKVRDLEGAKLWHYLQPMVEETFQQGSLYRIEKYIKVSHVLMDMAFDIGWDTVYSKASKLKALEGLVANPERAATLREVSLHISRNFWLRGFTSAAKQILFIGFPDIPQVIDKLSMDEVEDLLVEKSSKQAVQILFSEEMARNAKNVNCNQIVEGALRIISGT